ncbi:5'-methylthioadenosine/S-adenosylhomocysteine nucleosidase [Candidatus Pantoea edessiphila]|uniref:adenosylhomocysteine nucleosidase n=1 Tax=Candidatus Pantoea edessiphila TaxID=2044610 RepID=A0A2P5T252_9GAMM|nr:5'-methylthioadenosine/adenosylhomocysteine nucleosidase [Candidatus Pantoea edessiphila]PPI88669.1 5'-methylthioadenosine/S-adenosylhomocysteine nucleosidase [Candidatus Pantoea edessiphila]
MKIAIIGAMEEEIQYIRDSIDEYKLLSIKGYKIYIGNTKKNKIFLLESGIGKTIVTLTTTLLINLYNPDLIINIGTAGSLSSNLKIGDIVISKSVCYHDVDMTAFGYMMGQISGFPAEFTANKSLVIHAKICANQLKLKSKIGLIVSGDAFVNNIHSLMKICKYFPKAVAVEMEATSIAHVCYVFQIPFIAIRSISDTVDNKSYLNFREHLINSSKKCCKVVNKFLTNVSL